MTYGPAMRTWIATVAVAAGGVAALTARPVSERPAVWEALAVLGAGAAIAHFFPIRSAAGAFTFRLTSIFLIAGTMLLPPALLTVLAFFAVAPEGWSDRHRAGAARLLFNLSHTILALQAARLIVSLFGVRRLEKATDLAVLLGAAGTFLVVQNVIVGCAIAAQTRTVPWRTEVLRPDALATEGMFGLLGVVIAGMWFAAPILLVLVLPAILLAYHLTRNAHLASLAHVDSKTGLHNARAFERALEEELHRNRRSGIPVSLLFVDLDHFKSVNDRYGHAAGDLVLQEIAGVMTGALRRSDIVARFGGEEFVILLPGTYPDTAGHLAEQLRATIARHLFVLANDTVVHCTVSIGVASCPDDGADAPSLLARADWAMYQAKQTRNTAWQAALPLRSERRAATKTPPPEPPARRAGAWRVVLARCILGQTAIMGGGAALFGAIITYRTGNWLIVPPCMLLAVVAEFFPVHLYRANRDKLTISLTYAIIMAVVVLQPFAAPLVNVIPALAHVFVRRQRRLDKALFNVTNPALAAACSSAVFLLLRPTTAGFSLANLIASLASVLVFYVVNVGVVSLMISLHSERPFWQILRDNAWFGPIMILLGLTGAFVTDVHAELGWVGAVIFMVPVLLLGFTLAFAARKNELAIATLETAKTAVEHAYEEKAKTLRQMIEAVSSIIDARDNLVWGHSRNVSRYGGVIAEELHLPPTEIAAVRTAGLLHDLGKIAIPEVILNKPDTLTPEEYRIVQQHVATGQRILAEIEPLADVAEMVGDHHERFDGAGYPRGKEGSAISIGGRILAVADTLDSLLSDRSYARALPLGSALEEIDRCSGSQFDPVVVEALHRVVETHSPDYFRNSAVETPGQERAAEDPQIITFPTARLENRLSHIGHGS